MMTYSEADSSQFAQMSDELLVCRRTSIGPRLDLRASKPTHDKLKFVGHLSPRKSEILQWLIA